MNFVSSETVYANAEHAAPDAAPESSAAEVRTLNGLIVSVLDNIDDFRRAIFALEQHVAHLQRRLYNRVHAVEQLQDRVRKIGGEPATMRSILASAFANKLANRAPFAKNHREELLQDVERGEEAIKAQFQQYLASKRWFGPGKQCAQDVLDSILSTRCANGEEWSPQKVLATVPETSGLAVANAPQLLAT